MRLRPICNGYAMTMMVTMLLPTSGTASDVAGTIPATISWKTLSDSRIVIPKCTPRALVNLKPNLFGWKYGRRNVLRVAPEFAQQWPKHLLVKLFIYWC